MLVRLRTVELQEISHAILPMWEENNGWNPERFALWAHYNSSAHLVATSLLIHLKCTWNEEKLGYVFLRK